MAEEGLVRVEQVVGGVRERVWVSAEHVQQYLEDHPGAVALGDWQAEAAKAQRAAAREAKAADKKD